MRFRIPKSYSVADRQYFDEDLQQDSLDLLEASAALEVKEFKLFELAYLQWHGKKPLPHVIEAHFSNYMFNKIIPVWVRSYSRQVVKLHRSGSLNPRAFGVYQPLPSKRLIFIGRAFTTLLILIFIVFVLLLNVNSPTAHSLFGRADTPQQETPQHNAMP